MIYPPRCRPLSSPAAPLVGPGRHVPLAVLTKPKIRPRSNWTGLHALTRFKSWSPDLENDTNASHVTTLRHCKVRAWTRANWTPTLLSRPRMQLHSLQQHGWSRHLHQSHSIPHLRPTGSVKEAMPRRPTVTPKCVASSHPCSTTCFEFSHPRSQSYWDRSQSTSQPVYRPWNLATSYDKPRSLDRLVFMSTECCRIIPAFRCPPRTS